MKKLLSLLLASVIIISGCGKAGDITASEESEELNDLVPMVMVNDKIYIDSGIVQEGAGCGVMDGKITSSVPQSEKPKENDQSNFGKGYDYQYGVNSIHVLIDGKWCVFKEEAGENAVSSHMSGFENFVYLNDDDAEFLKEILDNGTWEEGTGDCLIDTKLKLDDKIYDYHASCGTFSYDGKSMDNDEEAKAKINEILEKYVVLGYDVP